MTLDHALRLLERIDVLKHPCDLDLLVFFARHPRTLLASQQLAILLGYEFTEVAASLDVLQRAGFVTVIGKPIDIPRMYVFTAGGVGAQWLPDLLQLASTREGRLVLMRAMRSAGERPAVPVERGPTAEPGPRPGPGRAKRAGAPRPASNKRRKGKRR